MTALKTLTDFEQAGLHSHYCLADGHAYQDLHPSFTPIVQALPEIWTQAAQQSIPDAERHFNQRYAAFIQAPILSSYSHFRICPTASNSIDLVAAVLKNLNARAALVEPTFDNLALLVKRRGVELCAIPDAALFHAAQANDMETLLPELKTFDALFLVHPNNPTGLILSEEAFKNIVYFCKKHHILLVIDHCFRLYRRAHFCDYSILIESGVRFMAFEDTGKVWPTQDLKASLIYYSEDLAPLFNELYNEIYLCVSNFSLGILSSFFDETGKAGLQKTTWDLVDTRRARLRATIAGSALSVSIASQHSTLPVEWLTYSLNDKNDIQLCQELKQRHLAVLPGRQFYWNSSSDPRHQQNIRISLMKTEAVFNAGIQILEQYCKTLKNTRHTEEECLMSV